MGLKNMSINTGATVSATGGTAKVFADDGVTIPNGVHCTVPATADYRVRESATWRYRPPTLTQGVYGGDTKSVSLTIPMLLASGLVFNNVIRIERKVHPEFSAANATDLNKLASQLLFDSDADNFWAAGSLS
jgi:hypothetical protein